MTKVAQTRKLAKDVLEVFAKNLCIRCGFCQYGCPGLNIDFNKLNRVYFGKEPKNILIGNYRSIWAGWATDGTHRYQAASGGLVTTLLVHALEEKLISGAVVLGYNKENPLIPKAYIARNPKEVINASGSNYLSGSIGHLIPEILNKKGKYAVVGQPCHLAALRIAQLTNKSLREKIIYHFGLFCQTKTTQAGLDFWFKVNNINKQDVVRLNYRGNGWPGGMTLKLKNDTSRFFPLGFYWQFLEKFTPRRCTLCTDSLAELADISFGDAWVSEYEKDTLGTSIAVIRTSIGEKLLKSAIKHEVICGTNVDKEMLIRSQKVSLKFKKDSYYYRTKLLSFFGVTVPVFKGNYRVGGSGSYPEAANFYLTRWFYQQRIFWPFIYYWKARILPQLKRLGKQMRLFIFRIISLTLNPIFYVAAKFNHFLLLNLFISKKKHFQKINNILIINQADMLNKGDAAILSGTLKIVKKAFPKAKLVISSHTPKIDQPRVTYPVIQSFRFLKNESNFLSFLNSSQLLFSVLILHLTSSSAILQSSPLKKFIDKSLLEFIKADLIIHRGGDNLTEDYGIPYIYFESLLIAILLRKPTIVMGESIGPFTQRISKNLASKILNNIEVIVTRETLSVNNLKQLNLTKPKIIILPDLAFSLAPSPLKNLSLFLKSEKIKNIKKPVFVISLSALIAKYAFLGINNNQKVNQLMLALVKTINYLQKEYKASIVFLPHVIGEGNDDRVISQEIVEKLRNRRKVYILNKEHSHEDYRLFLKTYADFFIGARMHANIAAVSVGIPTIAFSYSHKTDGIIGEMLGQKDSIIDLRKIKNGSQLYQEIIQKTNRLWNKRSQIKKELILGVTKLQQKTEDYIKLLRENFS
ncbi:MAG: polysaccharide pyruvyl transferase family protein [Actinobacteria bacterium]|nr:polysaccharide pyruvyl transferase family protein [Actinomycetota bacterium]